MKEGNAISDAHQVTAWPPIRNLVSDMLAISQRTHNGYGLLEFDVTTPLARIAEHKTRMPDGISFTAFLAYCLGHAIGEHPGVHACRQGGRLVVFDDVDISTLLEKTKPDGARVPVIYIVRAANRKSLAEINEEIRRAVRDDLYDDPAVRRRRRIVRMPALLRRGVWWWIRRDPVRRKRQWGTAVLSNVGSAIDARPSWGLVQSFLPCSVTVGGIFERVCWRNERAEPRKMMSVTVAVDHDIVDGVPGGRFVARFAELVEAAAGLDEEFGTSAGDRAEGQSR
ncbi:2-oxo acid dehydrogenase subunit E2 [Micromonospora radicis]|uniref:Dehydrogenase n=1 Tax=Micromonospora radicis TaxID=1894971 RepID=A0A418MNX1_9ACTN|nr:2-oxo acid dehydrogenase subunit E2 [Micromonospora radicis]RIV33203.1 dehydrogenase [Micromonospora radicis]